MQDQLHRIRNKDYSNIDERLYSNMGMTADLQTTITKLAELQRYLKSQINSIEDQGQKEAVMKASQVILTMNLENSQASSTRCKCKHSLKEVLEKVTRIKKSFKITKQSIIRQVKDCLSDFKQIFNENFTYLASLTTRKINQALKYKLQTQKMKMQIDDLKHKNMELVLKLQQWEQAKKRRKEKIEKQDQQQIISVYTSTQHQTSSRQTFVYLQNATTQPAAQTLRYLQTAKCKQKYFSSVNTNEDVKETQNDTPRLPMPLRRESSVTRYGSIFERYNSCQSLKEKPANSHLSTTAQNSPAKCNKQWNQNIGNPTPVTFQKQNQMLRLKGAQNRDRRKSTKKLKLFSLL